MSGSWRRFVKAALLCIVSAAPAVGQVTGLEGWSIVLDPGHSQTENAGVFGYSEAEKNLRVGLNLRDLLLETTDIDTVYMTRTNDLQSVSLSQRVDLANAVGASWFHSVHSNAGSPAPNHVFVLWPQYRDLREALPIGGRQMAERMGGLLSRSMRIPTPGFGPAIGECDFYGVSNCRAVTASTPKGSRNFVQSRTVMASELSEAGFHTNPVQNQRNMNEEWKRLEAYGLYWAILDFWGLARPSRRIVTGTISDVETAAAVNGAVISVDGISYTTDTYESLFRFYSDDPEELRNGFFFLEDVGPGVRSVQVEAEGYRTEEFAVVVEDTFFTFFDVQILSTVPPRVVGTSPESEAEAFRVVDPIVIDFSRGMDPASVEEAWSIDPPVGGRFVWTRRDFSVTFRADSLSALTSYTLRIGGTAVGAFGDPFDGSGDGIGGDDFTLTFTTGYRDVDPPLIVTARPSPRESGVALRPIVSVIYDELIDHGSVVPEQVTLAPSAGGGAVDGTLEVYDVGLQSVMTLFPLQDLEAAKRYTIRVEAGFSDIYGNEKSYAQQFDFWTGEADDEPTVIDDFESDLETVWWYPQMSGSTTGIVTDSTDRATDALVANRSSGGSSSMRIDYGWDDGSPEWLSRVYLSDGAPRDVLFDSTYSVAAFVFGDGSGNLFRFAVDDRVPDVARSYHEVSPWFELDWIGWRYVSWNPGSDGTGEWLGDGTLDGTLRFDSIQLSHVRGARAFGSVWVDDLEIVNRFVSTTVAESREVPIRTRLLGNYPNPFSTSTIIRFELASPDAVSLRVFNILGEEVARLATGAEYPAGVHEVAWRAPGMPSGIYVLRLDAGGRSDVRRVTHVK